MTRILAIPVAGTIAALIAITLARQPRGEAPGNELPEFDFPDAPEHAMPPEEEPETPEVPPQEIAPKEYDVRLEADGTLLATQVSKDPNAPGPIAYESIDELVEQMGDVRNTLVITNGEGVTKDALDAAEVRLRDHFKVVKVYRAPETPPEKDH